MRLAEPFNSRRDHELVLLDRVPFVFRRVVQRAPTHVVFNRMHLFSTFTLDYHCLSWWTTALVKMFQWSQGVPL